MFKKVLVANRGAVAQRIIRALRELDVRSVAVFSEADAGAPYLQDADEALLIGGPKPADSYLHQQRLIDVMAACGADAVHPGYGFLAENTAFATAVQARGIRFIGPAPRWINEMGHKTNARALMRKHGLQAGFGTEVLGDADEFVAAARDLGYPVLVKPAEGGGGIGMLAAHNDEELRQAVSQARSLAERAFGSSQLYLERLIERPRHIEFQVLSDGVSAMHLFERDCSIQRRHQKVIEEAPAPGISRAKVDAMADAVVNAIANMGYDNIGTVEMLLALDGEFGFLETNTRLQVEHGVTEMVTGVDIVKAQVRLAAGESLRQVVPSAPQLRGHAIEARVCAEDPKRFFPSPGVLDVYRPPQHANVRVDSGYGEGQRVTPHYDPLLAKVIAWGETRTQATALLHEALSNFAIEGVKSNIPALQRCLRSDVFARGDVHTHVLTELLQQPT